MRIYGLAIPGDFLIFFVIATLPWAVVGGLLIYGIVRLILWRIRVSREKHAAGGQRPR